MNSYLFVAATALVVLALIRTGDALQCWKCRSEEYGRCADHFNVTLFPRYPTIQNAYSDNPHLEDCDRNGPTYQTGMGAPYGSSYGYQRKVCMKKVVTDRRTQRKTYTRQCHDLVGNEAVGTCLSHNSYNDEIVDFCEYCDTHECNGAQNLQRSTLWVGLIPIAAALLLRK